MSLLATGSCLCGSGQYTAPYCLFEIADELCVCRVHQMAAFAQHRVQPLCLSTDLTLDMETQEMAPLAISPCFDPPVQPMIERAEPQKKRSDSAIAAMEVTSPSAARC